MTGSAPSPFLEGTRIQVAWDSTSLGYLKQCPRLYYYHLLEGWTSSEESVHLRFGIEYHHALQDYDLSRAAGINHDDSIHDVLRELLIRVADWDPDHKTKTKASLVRTVVWYLDQFHDDAAQTFIKSDGKPAVEQSFRWPLDWGPQSSKDEPYWLCGHLDKIVTYSGELYVMDHKTVYSFWGKDWSPDNQMTLYTIASRVVLDAPIRGVIVDMARVAESATEFKRDFTFRTQDQLDEWFADLHYWFALAEQYAVANYWPQNDTACDKFGGCRFREVCSKSPSARENFLKSNFIQLEESQRWNPLAVRG